MWAKKDKILIQKKFINVIKLQRVYSDRKVMIKVKSQLRCSELWNMSVPYGKKYHWSCCIWYMILPCRMQLSLRQRFNLVSVKRFHFWDGRRPNAGLKCLKHVKISLFGPFLDHLYPNIVVSTRSCACGDKVNIEITKAHCRPVSSARSRIRWNSFKRAHSTNPEIRFPSTSCLRTADRKCDFVSFHVISRSPSAYSGAVTQSQNMTLNVTPYTLGAERPNFPRNINSQRDFKTFINASLRFVRFTNVLMNLLT